MKYIFDFIVYLSIILAIVIILSSKGLCQSNLITKPAQVIKLTWNTSTDPDVWQYAIFYCQGADTNQFPIKTNVDPDTLWKSELISNWQYATVYDNKFAVEPKSIAGTTYLRLGVAAINYAGKYGLIKCIPRVIRIVKPSNITNVKTY